MKLPFIGEAILSFYFICRQAYTRVPSSYFYRTEKKGMVYLIPQIYSLSGEIERYDDLLAKILGLEVISSVQAIF